MGNIKAMKLLGIIVGIIGAGLFVWHLVNAMRGMDGGLGYMDHRLLSLVGGILVIVGTGIYILGRRQKRD